MVSSHYLNGIKPLATQGAERCFALPAGNSSVCANRSTFSSGCSVRSRLVSLRHDYARRLTVPLSQNIGSVAAYPFSPYVSDGLGRRAAVIIGATIMCIATVIQTASHSVGMFIGARYASRPHRRRSSVRS